mmetsp:Transcript_86144/g.196556  ORF Transcript_86144/g.196556 Transcript_86144/m.196556 type:complete len:295 (+) Transcript_86144:844-1728(+)
MSQACEIPVHELEAVRKLFRQHDSDGNGSLDAGEARSAVAAYYKVPVEDVSDAGHEVRSLCGDHKVDLAEFTCWCFRSRLKDPWVDSTHMRYVFFTPQHPSLDRRIVARLACLTSIHFRAIEKLLEEFRSIDLNGSGELDWVEVAAMIAATSGIPPTNDAVGIAMHQMGVVADRVQFEDFFCWFFAPQGLRSNITPDWLRSALGPLSPKLVLRSKRESTSRRHNDLLCMGLDLGLDMNVVTDALRKEKHNDDNIVKLSSKARMVGKLSALGGAKPKQAVHSSDKVRFETNAALG